ncbi:DUF445 domain-containing protein [Alteromonas halophila]|uniref:DUF445 domain-containing protein n=1 Tax=Alteromonas halophila TaxID=516698 RepID=A0A918MW26_9ALTE|nr:DUF445 family protein [Alteromonas halophila]GGW75462.1 hypothetical protein GCM10007391_04680 [Alteromonas halophila]
MDKVRQLQRAKNQALAWLIGAALVFIATTGAQQWYPVVADSHWLGLIKMASEAALIGGLADWFAVSALFRPIPSRFPIPHTNIVARNKPAIADNLSRFVRDKFFNTQALTQLIESSQPARGAGRWLQRRQNAGRAAGYLNDIFAGSLHLIDDAPVKAMLLDTSKRALNNLNLVPLIGAAFRLMSKERHHQALLNRLLMRLTAMLSTPAAREQLAEKLNSWLKTEHARLSRLLPSSWLSRQGADIAVNAIASTLQDINDDPAHPARRELDRQIAVFIRRLERDPEYAEKIDAVKHRLLNNAALHHYLHTLWEDLHQWLERDLASPQGKTVTALTDVFEGIGQRISTTPALAASLDKHISEAGQYMAPELAEFLTEHIRQTILAWDETALVEQIELNIGSDLQRVRINGTLVGGLIGALLYGIEQAIGLFR